MREMRLLFSFGRESVLRWALLVKMVVYVGGLYVIERGKTRWSGFFFFFFSSLGGGYIASISMLFLFFS
jgi:hypothetical protein